MSLEVTRVSTETARRHKKDEFEEKVKSHGEKPSGPKHGSDEPHGPSDGRVDFKQAPHEGLTDAQAAELLKKWGKNELAEKHTPTWLIILRLLTGPMPIMLWIAALIEVVIGNYADMGILLIIQFTNAGISFYETQKAGDAVAALKASLKPTATCKRNGKWGNLDATLIVPGDLVLLAAGSAVPADCYVNEGMIDVDQSAMTGESLPVKFRRGDICKLGSNVVRGETEGTVETTGPNTVFGKTASMLQSVGNDGGSLQILLMRVLLVLVTLSITLCTIALIYLIVQGRKSNSARAEKHQKADSAIVKESLSFAVVVLVASIPLAIEIVTTTTLALGSKQLSARGAIVTRLGAIEEMAGMDMLCSDKTGTLTLNKVRPPPPLPHAAT
jgi:H+-transporting ATPase